MQLFLSIPRVSKAFEFMVIKHKDQSYGNLPYFIHPLMVAEKVKDPTEDELVAALLHDVLEDTETTEKELSGMFGTNVSNIVSLLTKKSGLTYETNIQMLIASGNRSAMKIKWADNFVNMSGDKSSMRAERRDKLNARYSESFLILSQVLGI